MSVVETIKQRYGGLTRETVSADAKAGVALGVASIPDSLATGLLAGVNPVAGLYGFMIGLSFGSILTSTTFMAVQTTTAIAIIVSDANLETTADPGRALTTLSLMAGLIMVVAGLFKLGRLMKFVSRAVMTGFVTAVGVNIVLGQLEDLTGVEVEGGNRVLKLFDLLGRLGEIHLPTLFIGVLTIGLILALERTRLGGLGLVVAIAGASGAARLFGDDIHTVSDVAVVPNTLPLPRLPLLSVVPDLVVPALAIAVVGLIQGATISIAFPNPDGKRAEPSQDFLGQGFGAIMSGLLQGTPTGGDISSSTLASKAGAKSRLVFPITGAVMAVGILLFGGLIREVAMPTLAGLLIYVGFGAVRPDDIRAVRGAGTAQTIVMVATFVLMLLVPLQYAVLGGVLISIVAQVAIQSSRLTLKRINISESGLYESEPPPELGEGEVVVVQPYGGLFFATAQALEDQFPVVTERTRHSVLIIRVRGVDAVGVTVGEVLERYIEDLRAADSKLVIVTNNRTLPESLKLVGVMDQMGQHNIYMSNRWIMRTTRRAYDDALAWVETARSR